MNKRYELTKKEINESYKLWGEDENLTLFKIIGVKAQYKLLSYIRENLNRRDVGGIYPEWAMSQKVLLDLCKDFGVPPKEYIGLIDEIQSSNQKEL